jgi:hypothetical protein
MRWTMLLAAEKVAVRVVLEPVILDVYALFIVEPFPVVVAELMV